MSTPTYSTSPPVSSRGSVSSADEEAAATVRTAGTSGTVQKTSPSVHALTLSRRLLPLTLTAGIIIADQALKGLVVALIPVNGIGATLFGGVVRLIHTRNPGIAFSIGRGAPEPVRKVLFTVVPLLVLGGLLWFYLRTDGLTRLQRLAVAGVLGGGLGNLVDRVFRPKGVVDFVDVRFFGILGLDRWPTFNLADASVVVFGILLLISLFVEGGYGENE